MRIHEAAFLFLLTTLFLRLPFPDAILWGIYLLFSLWLYLSSETAHKKRIKEFLPIFSVPLLYFSLKKVMCVLNIQKQDLFLQKIDEFLLGAPLFIKPHPLLTECMYISYLLFFAYIIGTIGHYLKKSESVKDRFYEGLFTIYWIGFLGYTLVPGDGPYIFLTTPIQEGLWFTAPIHDLIYQATNHTDVFPSLHCAVSAFCLFFDRRHNRPRFWLFLPLCILIWISTIYLSYHYLIDVLAGFVLALLVLKITRTNPPMTLKDS